MDALIAWNDFWLRGLSQSPMVHSQAMQPFASEDGGKLVHYLAPGFQATTALKKASADRIQELLRICNWLAAPFGSQEDLLLSYGVADTDYTLDPNGNPIPTSRGVSDRIRAVAIRLPTPVRLVQRRDTRLCAHGADRREGTDRRWVGPIRPLATIRRRSTVAGARSSKPLSTACMAS